MAWTKAGPGRPPKPTERVTRRLTEAQFLAREIVENKEYRAQLLQRAVNGQLSPQMELLLYYYAYGRPVERLQVDSQVDVTAVDLSAMSPEQLEQRAYRLHRLLKDMRAADSHEDAIQQKIIDERLEDRQKRLNDAADVEQMRRLEAQTPDKVM